MFLSVVLLIVSETVVIANNNNLIAVVQIFRHGQRTPTSFYPTDPYRDIHFYWGGLDYGELTNEGKRQHLALGQFTRRRYSDWLPTIYNKNVIYVQTTDVDRTHMSAQSNLYGLFPATDTQEWRNDVDWQPIPVHPSDSRVVNTFAYPCPLYTYLLTNVTTDSHFVTLDTTYAKMYGYISLYANLSVTSFTDIMNLYDPLHIEEQAGFNLPSWTSAVYPEPVSTLAGKIHAMYTYSTKMKRLYIGVLLHNIIDYFEKMSVNKTSLPKYQMYSAHDTNVFAILDSIGRTPNKPVPFAVSLWFELRRVNFVDVVNLWMKSADNFTQLSILGCHLNCPLTQVRSLLADILVDVETWEKECTGTT